MRFALCCTTSSECTCYLPINHCINPWPSIRPRLITFFFLLDSPARFHPKRPCYVGLDVIVMRMKIVADRHVGVAKARAANCSLGFGDEIASVLFVPEIGYATSWGEPCNCP